MSGNIINDFKDLRSLIGEVTKANPAKTTYQQNAQKMGVMKEAPEAKPEDDKKAKALKARKDHAGEEEIKKAYMNLGRAAQGSVEYQRKLIQKELAKMGYKTYSKYAFDDIFKFENFQLENALADMQDIVKTKGAKKVGGVMVDMFTASVITKAYDKVNDSNKKKMEKANVHTLVKIAHKIMGMKEELELDEGRMSDLLIDIQQGATAKELARDFKIPLAVAKQFLRDYYGTKKGSRKESVKEAFNYSPKDFEAQVKAYKYKSGVKFSQVMKDFEDDWDSAFGNRGFDHDSVENGLKQALKKFRVRFVETAKEDVQEGMKLKDIMRKHGRELKKVARSNSLELSRKAEEDLMQWAMNSGEIRTDDPDEFDQWLDNNIDDIVKGRIKEENIQERFNQKTPAGKKLKDFEVFLDEKDIDKAIKLIDTRFKLDKIKYNKEMKNLKRGPSGMDVVINAVDEGDRWRLMVMGQERSRNFKELDMRILFDSIQGLPSAQFKGMYAEGTWALPKTSKQKKELKDLMKKPIKLGKNGDDASDAIGNLIGDDSLLDDIYTAGKKNPNGDARDIVKKHMKRLGIKEETREDKLKEQSEHAKKSPFKLKSQSGPRAIPIDSDGYGKRHASYEDIIEACETFGMITDKELQVEQIQKALGKKGFISYNSSELKDVFDARETERMILALESMTEQQEPINYTKGEIIEAYIMGEEIEFVKPDGQKTVGPVLKKSSNTYNVKDKFTGKSFTYKYIGEAEEVKTFSQVINEGRFPKKLVKMAMGVVWDKRYAGGNMTGAVKAIEKIKKGLSDDPDVRNALRLANEDIQKWIPEGGDKEAYVKFFKKALDKFGVNSPEELEGEKKKEFFNYVDKNWKGDHEEVEVNPSDTKIDGRRKNFREKMRKLGYIKGR